MVPPRGAIRAMKTEEEIFLYDSQGEREERLTERHDCEPDLVRMSLGEASSDGESLQSLLV